MKSLCLLFVVSAFSSAGILGSSRWIRPTSPHWFWLFSHKSCEILLCRLCTGQSFQTGRQTAIPCWYTTHNNCLSLCNSKRNEQRTPSGSFQDMRQTSQSRVIWVIHSAIRLERKLGNVLSFTLIKSLREYTSTESIRCIRFITGSKRSFACLQARRNSAMMTACCRIFLAKLSFSFGMKF